MSENGAEFENGLTDTCDDDCTRLSSTSKTNVIAGRMKEQILEKDEVTDSTIMRKWK
jgi:hypothetical protein